MAVRGSTWLVGIGSLLATLTPSADAWHTARRAERRARRAPRRLADWRTAATRDGGDVDSDAAR